MDFIACIEKATHGKAELNVLPAQPGEVPITYADATDLQTDFSFSPDTPIDVGIQSFVNWYRS